MLLLLVSGLLNCVPKRLLRSFERIKAEVPVLIITLRMLLVYLVFGSFTNAGYFLTCKSMIFLLASSFLKISDLSAPELEDVGFPRE